MHRTKPCLMKPSMDTFVAKRRRSRRMAVGQEGAEVAEQKTRYDTAVLVLRWWKTNRGRDSTIALFRKGKDGYFVNKDDLRDFIAFRITSEKVDESIAPHLADALNKSKAQLPKDAPEYIRLALKDALERLSKDASSASSQDSDAPQSDLSANSGNEGSGPKLMRIESERKAIRSLGSSLIMNYVERWPSDGTDKAMDAVKGLPSETLTMLTQSGAHSVGFYRVLRWAAPSLEPQYGPRIGQAFAIFGPHAGLRSSGPFASFTLYYRPFTFIAESDVPRAEQIRDEPLRISVGAVTPIGSHMYLFGQEHVADVALGSHSGESPDEKKTLLTSGYPLIVACSLPDTKMNFEGIVLRQTDRASQVLASRVYFEKMQASEFGETYEAAMKEFSLHANENCGLYPVGKDGKVSGLDKGDHFLKLLDKRFRNLERIAGPEGDLGRYAITLPIPKS